MMGSTIRPSHQVLMLLCCEFWTPWSTSEQFGAPGLLRGGTAGGQAHRRRLAPQPGPPLGREGRSAGPCPGRGPAGPGPRTPLRAPQRRRAGLGRGSGQGRRGRSRPQILDGFSLSLPLPPCAPFSLSLSPSPSSPPPPAPLSLLLSPLSPSAPSSPGRPAPPLALASSPGHAAHRAHINGGIFRGGHRPQTHPPRPLQERHPLPRRGPHLLQPRHRWETGGPARRDRRRGRQGGKGRGRPRPPPLPAPAGSPGAAARPCPAARAFAPRRPPPALPADRLPLPLLCTGCPALFSPSKLPLSQSAALSPCTAWRCIPTRLLHCPSSPGAGIPPGDAALGTLQVSPSLALCLLCLMDLYLRSARKLAPALSA